MPIASDQRERGNLIFLTRYEIASVVLLPRNDITTQPAKGGGDSNSKIDFQNV